MSFWQRTALALACLSPILSFATTSIAQPGGGGPPTPITVTTPPPGELRELMSQFQVATSMSFGANVELIIGPPHEHQTCAIPVPDPTLSIPIGGRFELRAADARYLTISHVDPTHMPWMQAEVGYDGIKYQLLLSDGTLSLQSSDSASILPILPNPLLQLVTFRYPLTDANFETEIRIQDIWNDQIPESFWQVSWSTFLDEGLIRERALFPGGSYEGRSYLHHVITPLGRRRTPVRIDRIDDQGKLLTRAEFSDYHTTEGENGSGYSPYRIVLKSFVGDNVLAVQISYTVTEFSVGQPMVDSEFIVPENHAQRVWDGATFRAVSSTNAGGGQ